MASIAHLIIQAILKAYVILRHMEKHHDKWWASPNLVFLFCSRLHGHWTRASKRSTSSSGTWSRGSPTSPGARWGQRTWRTVKRGACWTPTPYRQVNQHCKWGQLRFSFTVSCKLPGIKTCSCVCLALCVLPCVHMLMLWFYCISILLSMCLCYSCYHVMAPSGGTLIFLYQNNRMCNPCQSANGINQQSRVSVRLLL